MLSLAVVPLLVLFACGGDGDETELLAPGDYALQVSGTLDIEFVGESVSAVAAGQTRNQTANVSGDVSLKMGKDGSFELKEWGISGTVQVDGDTVTITATDSPREPSTGKTDSGGTETDVYWKAETADQRMYVGYNAETIGMSGDDPLTPDTRSFTQETGDDTDVPFMSDAGDIFLRLHGVRLNFSVLGGGETPTPQETVQPTPTPTPEPQPTTPSSQVQEVRVEQEIKCQHTQPGVRSDLFDLIIVYLKENFPAQNRDEGSGSSPALVLAVGDGALAAGAAGPALGQEVPLEGATVNATVQGPGVIDQSRSGVTDANGAVTLRFGINKFGAYNITVGSVVAPDGKLYTFDQESVLSLTYEVGPVCELTPTPGQ